MSRFVPLVVIALVTAGCGEEERRERAHTPQPPVGWSELTPAPIARESAATVWTGRELISWGGNTNSDAAHHADGAAYEPASDTWRLIAPAPLSGRDTTAVVWTGEEMLVWGGWESGSDPKADGAAYDPERDSWRALARAPLSPRAPAVAVWTGREMIVWGSSSRVEAKADGAAYDPALDRWRRIAVAPTPLNRASAIWTGDEMVVVGALLDGNNRSRTGRAQGLAYEPERDVWRTLPASHLSPQASSAAWTGKELVVWDYLLDAAAYVPASDRWTRLPRLPLRDMECYPQSARIGATVLGWYCGQAASFDTATGRWRTLRVPDPPPDGRLIAAGSAVLLAGSRALWAYEPPDY